MSAFIDDLVVKLLVDDKDGVWQLTQKFSYQSDLAKTTFEVPVGFKTNFCSVPRVPGVYDILGDRARKSGTVHDFLYTWPHPPGVNRTLADQVLREMLEVDGLNTLEADAFYAAVRIAGESHWELGPAGAPVPAPAPPAGDDPLNGA